MGKVKKTDLLWLAAFLAGFGLVLYKCRFGFANIDESFYLTIPYRFFQGDAMCLEEWNLGQISSVLLYPFVWLYLTLTGSTEGILLAFRYLFALLHAGVAVFIYLRLRKVNWGALPASLLYLVFAPFGIMALSYNSMAIGLLVIACITLYRNKKHREVNFYFAGLCFAGAVLCCPHLILVYAVYGMGACVVCWIKKRQQAKRPLRTLLGFFWFTVGCIMSALAFLAFLFSKCTVEQFLKVLPLILDDPSHETLSFLYITAHFFLSILQSNPTGIVVFPLALMLAVVILLDKKKAQRIPVYYAAAAVLTAVYAIPFLTTQVYINYMMFPLAILGFFCFLLKPKALTREMVYLWVPGILYAFCINWASNQKFYAISDAVTLSTLGSLVMAVSVLKSILPAGKKALGRCFRVGTAALMAVFVLFTAKVRYDSLFWEKGAMAEMTYSIATGAHKGLLVSPGLGESYDSLRSQTASIREDGSQKVLYYTTSTWLYLDDAKRNASFSSWMGELDSHSAEKLLTYYRFNPQKLPDIAYCPRENAESFAPLMDSFTNLGYSVRETEDGWILRRT